MISEVDLRDWDMVDFSLVTKAELEEPSYYSVSLLFKFAEQVGNLHRKQTEQAQKNVAALLRS